MKPFKTVLLLALTAASLSAFAKLPPPTDEQKAKAEEAKAAAADKAKADAELLGKAQDRVADQYIKAQKAQGVTVKPTPIAPPPAAAAPPVATPAAAPAAKK